MKERDRRYKRPFDPLGEDELRKIHNFSETALSVVTSQMSPEDIAKSNGVNFFCRAVMQENINTILSSMSFQIDKHSGREIYLEGVYMEALSEKKYRSTLALEQIYRQRPVFIVDSGVLAGMKHYYLTKSWSFGSYTAASLLPNQPNRLQAFFHEISSAPDHFQNEIVAEEDVPLTGYLKELVISRNDLPFVNLELTRERSVKVHVVDCDGSDSLRKPQILTEPAPILIEQSQSLGLE